MLTQDFWLFSLQCLDLGLQICLYFYASMLTGGNCEDTKFETRLNLLTVGLLYPGCFPQACRLCKALPRHAARQSRGEEIGSDQLPTALAHALRLPWLSLAGNQMWDTYIRIEKDCTAADKPSLLGKQ